MFELAIGICASVRSLRLEHRWEIIPPSSQWGANFNGSGWPSVTTGLMRGGNGCHCTRDRLSASVDRSSIRSVLTWTYFNLFLHRLFYFFFSLHRTNRSIDASTPVGHHRILLPTREQLVFLFFLNFSPHLLMI